MKSVADTTVDAGVACPVLNVSNAIVNTSRVNYPTSALVTCRSGFEINATAAFINVNCNSSGMWSVAAIECRRK